MNVYHVVFPSQHVFFLPMTKYFGRVLSGVVFLSIFHVFSSFASFLDDYWGNFGEILKFISFSAYFSLYLETNYFGECSPCGISPSACFFVLMVKYFGGLLSRVVLLGIFFCYSLILLFWPHSSLSVYLHLFMVVQY